MYLSQQVYLETSCQLYFCCNVEKKNFIYFFSYWSFIWRLSLFLSLPRCAEKKNQKNNPKQTFDANVRFQKILLVHTYILQSRYLKGGGIISWHLSCHFRYPRIGDYFLYLSCFIQSHEVCTTYLSPLLHSFTSTDSYLLWLTVASNNLVLVVVT